MAASPSLDENLNNNNQVDLDQLLEDVKAGIVNVQSKPVQDLLDRLFPEIFPIGSWGFEDKLRSVKNQVYQLHKIVCASGSLFHVYRKDTEHMWGHCTHSGFKDKDGSYLHEELMIRLKKERVALNQHQELVQELKRNLTLLNANWWIKAEFPTVLDKDLTVKCYYFIQRSQRICCTTMKVSLPMQNKRLFPLLCLVEQVYGFAAIICADLLKVAIMHPAIKAVKAKERAKFHYRETDTESEESAQETLEDSQEDQPEIEKEKDNEAKNLSKKKVFVNKTPQGKLGQTAIPVKTVGEEKVKKQPKPWPMSTTPQSISRASSKSPSSTSSRAIPSSRSTSRPTSRSTSRPTSGITSGSRSRPISKPKSSSSKQKN